MKYVKLTPSPYTHDTTANQLRFNVSREDETLFHMEFDMGNRGYLDRDQARQLRDEITAFLGERPCCHDANEALRRDNEDLTRQKDRLITANRHLRDLRDECESQYQAKAEDVFRLEGENETLRQRVASLEKDKQLDDVRIRLHSNRAQLYIEDYKKLESEAEQLRQRVASLEKSNDDLTRQKDRLLAENIRLSTEKANLNAAINDSQQSAQQLKAENENIRDQMDKFHHSFASLHKDCWATETENEKLRQRVASLEKTAGDALQDRHNIRAENARLKKRVAQIVTLMYEIFAQQ